MFLNFSTLKDLGMKNNDICCSPTFEVGYCIWHEWPANFFEYDRPNMCESVAVEWW